jgi:hypothetical protein
VTKKNLYSISALFAIWAGHANGKNYAVIIGAGNYPPEAGLNALAADKDTNLLSSALQRLGWEVTLLNAEKTEVNLRPTQANMLRTLGIRWNSQTKQATSVRTGERFTGDRDLGPSDIVMFYFGGHGITDQNDQDNLLPLDTRFQDGRIANPDRLVQVRWVRDALRATNAGKIVLIIDACREGAGGRATPRFGIRTATADVPPLATVNPPDNQRFLIFKSTGVGKWAHEMQMEGMGVFSYFLVKSLTDNNVQRAANRLKDGQLTLRDVVTWVAAQTSQFVDNLPSTSKKGPQEPWLEGDSQLDFVLTKVALPPPPPPPVISVEPRARPAEKPEIDEFTVTPERITEGGTARLRWRVSNASRVAISPEVGTVDPEGSTRIRPTETTTYKLRARGAGGTAESEVEVEVREKPVVQPSVVHFCGTVQGGRICPITPPLAVGTPCWCPGVAGYGVAVP